MKVLYGYQSVTIIFKDEDALRHSIRTILEFRDKHPDLHVMILPAAVQIGNICKSATSIEINHFIADLEQEEQSC